MQPPLHDLAGVCLFFIGDVMAFKPNRAFKKDYNKLFKDNPATANTYLLICELADDKGRVKATEEELFTLFRIRFNNPMEYQL